MNTPLLSLLALTGLTLPVLHLAPALDRDPGQDPGQQGAGKERADRREGGAQKASEQAAMAATYFKVADYDGNGWISYREASESLGIDRRRFSVYDGDRDGRITLEEYTRVFINTFEKLGAVPPPVPNPDDPNALRLADLLAEAEEPPEVEVVEAPLPKTVLELLGTVTPRSNDDRGAPQPGQIVGPVPSFHRLDYDGNGGISHENLEVLARGSGLDLRLSTLLASLDQNGDGVIDQSEFTASMRGAPKSSTAR